MRLSRCPVCDSPETETVLALETLPVFSNVLHDTRRQALDAQCAPIQLDCCARCGFIYNAIFEPGRVQYSPDYENDLSASPRFCRYADDLARELVRRYDLNGSDIVEIGCGNGYFLKLICAIGQSRGIGFDPGHDPQCASADRNQGTIQIVTDVYSQSYRDRRADMVCCRHVLEHIYDPLAFLLDLRGTVGSWNDCLLFFEVPNARHTFVHGAVWDILYEHCNYFTERSLRALFEAAGFRPLRVKERYEGQFLTIEARCDGPVRGVHQEMDSPDTVTQFADFQSSFQSAVDLWQEQIAAWAEQHKRIVAWGAGTKGATFLNVLGLSHDTVEYIVDIHPHKQGKFVPGTGQEIIPPASLARFQPDVVIVMNPIYLKEIRRIAGECVAGAEFVAASAPDTLSKSVVASNGIAADSNMTPVPESDDEYRNQ